MAWLSVCLSVCKCCTRCLPGRLPGLRNRAGCQVKSLEVPARLSSILIPPNSVVPWGWEPARVWGAWCAVARGAPICAGRGLCLPRESPGSKPEGLVASPWRSET